MSEQTEGLQNEFLSALRRDHVPVSLFLVNGIRLAGHIESFDQYSIQLQGVTSQLVLKRVVATVVPDTGPPRPRQSEHARPARPPRGRPPQPR